MLTFYGSSTFHGLNDAAWAKYRLGEFLEITDPAMPAMVIAVEQAARAGLSYHRQ